MIEVASPIMSKLISDIKNNKPDSVQAFWKDNEAKGTPLIEEIEGDNYNVLITFLYKEKKSIENIIIYGGVPGYRYEENLMEKLLNTDIWYKTYKIRNDVKFKYKFSINYKSGDKYSEIEGKSFVDPLNINIVNLIKNEEDPEDKDSNNSLAKLPKADPDKWIIEVKDVPRGELEVNRFNSEILDDTRRVWVYKPYGYEETGKPYKLLVLSDGFDHLNHLHVENVINNLIYQGKIPPIVCVLFDNLDKRYEELTCSENFSNFVVKELMPWVYKKYNVTKEPEETIISGISLGGLMASYIAFKNPHVFGKVLSQSGSYWYEKEWLTTQFKKSSRLPIDFYLNAGVLEDRPYDDEPIMMEVINNFRDVLSSKGYKFKYENFKSAHDYLSWGDYLANGLISLIGV